MTTDAAVAPLRPRRHEIVRVYVWEMPGAHHALADRAVDRRAVGHRVLHRRPFMTVSGPAGQSFVMGWMKVIHGYTAYVFIAGGARARHLDVHRQQVRALGQVHPVHRSPPQASGRRSPSTRSFADKPPAYVGHNPVAAPPTRSSSACTSWRSRPVWCMRGAAPTSGLVPAWFASLSPLFGGLQMARWIHHVVMWLLLGFAVHHVYSALLMSIVEPNGTDRLDLLRLQVGAAADLEPGPIAGSTAARSMSETHAAARARPRQCPARDDGVGAAAVAPGSSI